MGNMTVGKKIGAGFGVLILLAAVVGGVGTWKAGQVESLVSDLGKTHLPLAILGGKIVKVAGEQELAANLYVIHGEKEFIDQYHKWADTEDRQFEGAKKIVGADPELVKAGWLDKVENIAEVHDRFQKAGLDMIAAAETANPDLIAKKSDLFKAASDGFDEAISEFEKLNNGEAHRVEEEALGHSHFAKTLMAAVSTAIFAGGLLLAFFITRGITVSIRKVVDSLNQGADQVASAAAQVSSSGQQMAEGASEQASSIEETSSSLEEMSSMTRQNAGNANQADSLMKEAKTTVGRANDSMADVTRSMGEIERASQETSKIIKTIDEIAFQTNLLALNAAVEAARAGEAGAGFAVVADEVRNLALRAADAAKSTSDLIEGTVKKVKEGTGLVDDTGEAFAAVAESAGKVAELVGEIAAASSEQAQGIDQVNTAVSEMDKVTQQNAANAEESASAAEELSAQAEQMKANVEELVAMVGGGAAHEGAGHKGRKVAVAAGSLLRREKSRPAARVVQAKAEKSAAEKQIPFDDGEFAEF